MLHSLLLTFFFAICFCKYVIYNLPLPVNVSKRLSWFFPVWGKCHAKYISRERVKNEILHIKKIQLVLNPYYLIIYKVLTRNNQIIYKILHEGKESGFLRESLCDLSTKKNVSIVCSTGIAATRYGELWVQTLHKWFGIEDGRHLNEEIIHLVKTDRSFPKQKKYNILSAETIVLDKTNINVHCEYFV